MTVRVTLSEPVVVARGPRMEDAGWGPYQFPALSRLDDGSIYACFCDCRDSSEDYAVPRVGFVSRDEGRTFEPAPEDAYGRAGVKLPGGDRLTALALPPQAFSGEAKSEGENYFHEQVCRLDALPEGAVNPDWPFVRLPKGASASVNEYARVNQPNRSVCRLKDGRLIPPKAFGRLRVSPSGEVWHTTYGTELNPVNGGFSPFYTSLYFSSKDGGHSWDYRSFIPYVPDVRIHPMAFHFEGFCESDVAFPPAGGMITLMRLDSRAPSYIARSEDGNQWSEPVEFDKCGVWPCLLTLNNGVTLASYGRPGVYVRATSDPEAMIWDAPVTVIPAEDRSVLMNEPTDKRDDACVFGTCSYTDMLPLGGDEALLIYSDFFVPDDSGVKRKTMLCRRVKAVIA